MINGMINNHYADSIIAVAEAAKDNLTATGVSEKKITVILNGVTGLIPDCASLRSETRERFGVGENDRVVSIVARLEDIKGHDYFIDAAKQFKGQGIKFLIAGTGSYEEHLKQRVRDENLADTVIFTGFIRDVERLMNITDIQVNASFGTEATSLALLEGMSLGIPAVVSDFGGNPGVIADGVNGFVVPKKNAAAIAEKLRVLLEDEEVYVAMRQQSARIFNEKFTAEAMTRNTEYLYLKTLGLR
jgi:glycosyltransferase involved in cell wall biosynthesis